MSCNGRCTGSTSAADQRAARRLTSSDIATDGLHYTPPIPPTLSEMAAKIVDTPVENNQEMIDR